MKIPGLFISGVTLFLWSIPASSQSTVAGWSAFDMGSAISTHANISVKSAVGQEFAGTSRGTTMQIISGFLADTSIRGFVVSVEEEHDLPFLYALKQNHPNPFNPNTTIRYELPKASHVLLKVFSILGQESAVLVNEDKMPGAYYAHFDATGLPSGVYFYRLVAGNYFETKKMLFIK